MKRIFAMFVAMVFGLSLATQAQAGSIVIDGTDSADHGSANATTNFDGWFYMQRVLENLGNPANTPGITNKTLTVLGTSSTAQAAINSAFLKSNLVAAGWSISFKAGSAAIGTALTNLSLANTGILYIPTAGGNVSGDLTAAELAVVNAHAAEINNFVNAGGALFAQAESGAGEWGWLSTLLPGLNTIDDGTGGVSTSITPTALGFAAFPGITSADLSAGPWHNHFSGDLGGLQVLGTSNGQAIIIGGTAGSGGGTFVTPEPASLTLLGLGVLGLAGYGVRRRKVAA